MKPFIAHEGIVVPLDRPNVDTDAILPKQFLKRVEKKGYGKYLFFDWRYHDNQEENPEFILNKHVYKKASILLTRKNFGSGSSREHAPWALKDFGFRVIIAPSFADIFYNNCFKNGILPIVISETLVSDLFENVNRVEGYTLRVDLDSQTIEGKHGFHTRFEVDSFRKEMLLNGRDEISMTLQEEELIEKFEGKHNVYFQFDVPENKN
ncbi:3-isopropylmalate dehydratase small subunit [Pseudalkalibacillus caeni]|uniref:3-isopropylmalate dehydratase small subunit n=1 Tax=Exobacillus caeni TaxID=2574798 RepID=A0A5R9F975_9BACL|nr:3-isopropylmalate dehydratase small subunit [Pseudalkalibacillus caeni]TLS36255.1 3-isopropylmalate dehydratase small subunit [Pseudalkalibacillus caeni]